MRIGPRISRASSASSTLMKRRHRSGRSGVAARGPSGPSRSRRRRTRGGGIYRGGRRTARPRRRASWSLKRDRGRAGGSGSHICPLPPVVSLVDIDTLRGRRRGMGPGASSLGAPLPASDLGPLRPFQASVPRCRGPRGPVRLRGDSQGAAPLGRGSLGQPGGSRRPTQVLGDVANVPVPGPRLL